MAKKFKSRSERNLTIVELYEAYRNEMRKTLELEKCAPQKFSNVEFVEHYARKVERLETLTALFADLMLTLRNWN